MTTIEFTGPRFCSCCGQRITEHLITCGGFPGQAYPMEGVDGYQPQYCTCCGTHLVGGEQTAHCCPPIVHDIDEHV